MEDESIIPGRCCLLTSAEDQGRVTSLHLPQFSTAAGTDCRKLSGSNNTHVLSCNSGGQKFKAGLSHWAEIQVSSLPVNTARLFSGHSEENPLPSLSSSWKPPTFLGPFLHCSCQQHAMCTQCSSSQPSLLHRTVSDLSFFHGYRPS